MDRERVVCRSTCGWKSPVVPASTGKETQGIFRAGVWGDIGGHREGKEKRENRRVHSRRDLPFTQREVVNEIRKRGERVTIAEDGEGAARKVTRRQPLKVSARSSSRSKEKIIQD